MHDVIIFMSVVFMLILRSCLFAIEGAIAVYNLDLLSVMQNIRPLYFSFSSFSNDCCRFLKDFGSKRLDHELICSITDIDLIRGFAFIREGEQDSASGKSNGEFPETMGIEAPHECDGGFPSCDICMRMPSALGQARSGLGCV
jgi:hypothetical protein